MKIVLSHSTGNANVREAVKGIFYASLLARFYTTVGCIEGDFAYSLGKVGFLKDIRRRSYDSSLKSSLKTHPLMEICRLIAIKFKVNGLVEHEKGAFSIDSINKNLDLYLSKHLYHEYKYGTQGIYCYEDCAKLSFETAKEIGLHKYYDLPTGHWRSMRRLLTTEKEIRPEWASTIMGFKDSDEKLFRKDEEIRLADSIFVASSFTARTLLEFPEHHAPVCVLPYGFPDIAMDRNFKISNKKLKLLFVGKLSQAKGIANLFEAVSKYEEFIDLTLVGRKTVQNCKALNNALSKHTWIPSLSHSEILNIMKQCDILVFPSLFDGFGLAITEAMSQGTPVIATERTCAPDFIKDGENGWIMKAGFTESLVEKLEWILRHRSRIPEIGREAMRTASNRPWSMYGKELALQIQGLKSKL